MPDAIYLYTTGFWQDNSTRTHRIGSETLDFVGKCFNDGSMTECCLLVKFACHKEEFNDDQKWYIYPQIRTDADIWSIIEFTPFYGSRSVGKGYHNKVHPFLKTTEYRQVTVPSLRIYTSRWWWYKNNIWTTAPGWSTYQTYRPFEDITMEGMPYTHTHRNPSGYHIFKGYFHRAANQYDTINKVNVGTASFLQNETHVKSSYWTRETTAPFFTDSYGKKEIFVWGMIYDSSIMIAYEYIQTTTPPTRTGAYEMNGLNLVPKLST